MTVRLTSLMSKDLNPLQIIRDVIQQYDLTSDDILHRIKKKIVDEAMNFNMFKDCMMRLDASLTPLQIKSLFDTLKNDEGRVEIYLMLENFTGEQNETVDFKKVMAKRISEHIQQNGLMN